MQEKCFLNGTICMFIRYPVNNSVIYISVMVNTLKKTKLLFYQKNVHIYNCIFFINLIHLCLTNFKTSRHHCTDPIPL